MQCIYVFPRQVACISFSSQTMTANAACCSPFTHIRRRRSTVVISARNGYPGQYPLPGYPVRTRVPGNFYYPVADHSTLSFRLWIWCNSQRISQVCCKFTCKLQVYCTTHHRLAYYGIAYSAYLLITQDSARPFGATASVTHFARCIYKYNRTTYANNLQRHEVAGF